jgi:hypothetical protein
MAKPTLTQKLLGVAAIALADAFDFWRVPAVELGTVAHRFAAGRLWKQAFGIVQRVAKCFLNGLDECGHLATHLTLQPSNEGALTFDGFAHAFELAGMAVTPRFVAQQLALLGVRLFELDSLALVATNTLELAVSSSLLSVG